MSAPTDKITIEFISPTTGKPTERYVRGDVDEWCARWNDKDDGRMIAISYGWPS